ncbi:MAG: hypothetical protein XD97_0510, partial [Pelotomaculum thermopropionicum]
MGSPIFPPTPMTDQSNEPQEKIKVWNMKKK